MVLFQENPHLRWRFKHTSANTLISVHEFRKSRHKYHLANFTKALHALGIDVDKHIQDLAIEEAELRRARRQLGKADFVEEADKAKLKKILSNFKSACSQLVELELNIWSGTKPLMYLAHRLRMSTTDIDNLRALKVVSKWAYSRRIAKIKQTLPQIRNLTMASIHLEKIGIFDIYPQLLSTVEKSCLDMIALEDKWGSKGSFSRARLLKIHSGLRKAIHEDVYELSKDIMHMYELRADVYEWMVEAAREARLKNQLQIRHEYHNILTIWKYYTDLFNEHHRILNDIYMGKKIILKEKGKAKEEKPQRESKTDENKLIRTHVVKEKKKETKKKKKGGKR